MSHPTDTRSWLFGACAVAAVFLAGTVEVWSGRIAPHWDAQTFFAPEHGLAADFARAMRLRLWNPWSNCGTPDYVDPQTGSVAPTTIALSALLGPSAGGFVAYWLVLWLAGALGMLVLGRALGAPAWAAVVAALALLFSGLYVGCAQHTSYVHGFAFLPWILWRLDRASRDGRVLPSVEAGALWGAAGLAGHPTVVVLTAVYCVAWLGASSVQGGRETAWRSLRSLVLFAGIGVAVLSPVYVGFSREAVGYSDRAGPLRRAPAVSFNALHPEALATAASPYVAPLKLSMPRLWSYTGPGMASVYLGPIALLLASLAVAFGDARDRTLFATGAFFLACSLGRALPVRGWLYDGLPPFRYIQHSATFRYFWIVSLTVLGMRGGEVVVRLRGGSETTRRIASGVLYAVAIVTLVTSATVLGSSAGRALPVSAIVTAIVAWLGGAALVSLAMTGRRGVAIGCLLALASADALVAGHASMDLIGRRVPRRRDTRTIWSPDVREVSIERIPAWRREPGVPQSNQNLSAKVEVFDAYTPFSNRFHSGMVGCPGAVAFATGRDRFWFTPDAASVARTEREFEEWLSGVESGEPRIVIHAPRQMCGEDSSPPEDHASRDGEATGVRRRGVAMRVPAEVQVSSPDELALRVWTPGPGWVLVTDRWAPGWRASVDGAPVEVWGGNFVFRAVRVDGPCSLIAFRYRPFGYPWLLALSWGTLAAAATATALSYRTRKPRLL
ncbi:MAG: hypothetical protein U0167_00200 [bacterium]